MGAEACKAQANCRCFDAAGGSDTVHEYMDFDFDKAARFLSRCEEAASLDLMFEHPSTQGRLYVGSQRAASSREDLRKRKITRVVNCLDLSRPNFFEDVEGFEYLRFPIAYWRGTHMTALKHVAFYFAPLLGFVQQSLKAGQSVLVHCLAGAHRAGTAGIACLMFFMALKVDDAVALAKKRRPVIDPIAGFPILLQYLESALEAGEMGRAIEVAAGLGFQEAAMRFSTPQSLWAREDLAEDRHIDANKAPLAAKAVRNGETLPLGVVETVRPL